jgi:hypothetical protein
MKKILVILAVLISFHSFGQAKQDTTVHIVLSMNDYRILVRSIDQNIDSKAVTKALFELMDKGTQIIADKPKEKKP